VGALTVVAVLFPSTTARLLAVAGLAFVGAAYVLAADRLAEGYLRDLAAVRGGQPVSGEIRAEVYHEVGFERNREADWSPSPSRRHPVMPGEPSPTEGPETGSAAKVPARSGPPSGGS
jgi:hypothetical protein